MVTVINKSHHMTMSETDDNLNEKMRNILRAKCVIAGDSAVGKTALNKVFLSNRSQFPKNYVMTCGVDLATKSINIPDSNDVVELYLFDSSGKDVYIDVLQKYWSNPNLICIVFDVTNESSLVKCETLFRILHPVASTTPLPGVLLGNKSDLQDRRVVSPKAAQEVAKKLGLLYFECSAKDGKGVEEPFFYLANEFHKLYLEKKVDFEK